MRRGTQVGAALPKRLVGSMKNYGQVKGRRYGTDQPEPKLKGRKTNYDYTSRYMHRPDNFDGQPYCPACHKHKPLDDFLKGGRRLITCSECRSKGREWLKKRKESDNNDEF